MKLHNTELKFDWDDITLVPAALSSIESRKDINPFDEFGMLPLVTAPMDMVVGQDNAYKFHEQKINVVLPRGNKYEDIDSVYKDDYFYSYGLDEVIEIMNSEGIFPPKVLIDIANGHMKKLLDTSKRFKKMYPNTKLMVGNIANPEIIKQYCEAGVDFLRLGIGAGNVCTTSSNTSIHYPMASLITECREELESYKQVRSCNTKLIADGGFKTFADIIKALALGADYVMVGSMLSKSIESISKSFLKSDDGIMKEVSDSDAIEYFNAGGDVYKYYRGMSTKEVQISWGKKNLKTSEGISKYNKVEYTLPKWTENFEDYLRSSMSYCDALSLSKFRNSSYIKITERAFGRFNK